MTHCLYMALCVLGLLNFCKDIQSQIDPETYKNIFLQAHALYDKGDFKAASGLLKPIENKGFASWNLLGMCLKKLNESVSALAAFKNAQKNAQTYDQFHKAEVEILRLKDSLQGTQLHVSTIESFIQRLLFFFPILVLQLMFIFSFWALIALCSTLSAHKNYIGIILIFMLWVLIAFGLLLKYEGRKKKALIKVPTAISVNPGDSHTIMTTLNLGDEISVVAAKGPWSKIRFKRYVGFVPTSTLEQI